MCLNMYAFYTVKSIHVQTHCAERVRTNLCDVLKAFEQVRLYSGRIFGLGQNLQELII